MASRSTNTMAEFLQRMLGDLAEAKTLPDADLQFLISLETTILQKLRAPIDALMGQMEGDQSQSGQLAGVQGAMTPDMLPSMPGAQPAARVTGTRMEMPQVNMDELTRSMGGAR